MDVDPLTLLVAAPLSDAALLALGQSAFGPFEIVHEAVAVVVDAVGADLVHRGVDVALGVVSPRRFVPEYQIRICRRDFEPLGLESVGDAQVLVVVSRQIEGLSLNLRAPLVINVDARRGRQIIAKDPLPVQFILPTASDLRRSA